MKSRAVETVAISNDGLDADSVQVTGYALVERDSEDPTATVVLAVSLDEEEVEQTHDEAGGISCTGNAVTPRVAQHLFERVVAALP